MNKWRIGLGIIVVLVAMLSLPQFVSNNYTLHVIILSLMYVAFALSFDIAAGHLGTISLAHPVFFGLGSYTAAILSTRFGIPFWANMLLSMVLAFMLARMISIPAFRLRDVSFAIATLGLALSAQLVVNNWVEVTEGPLCIKGIPRPEISLLNGTTISIGNQVGNYYLFLAFALFTVFVYILVTGGRLGRVLTAVRNDETLAATVGVDVIRYKRFGFLVGASLAGGIGSLWAQYMTVVCPTNMGIAYTNNLLIIIFVGGAGILWGVVTGAIVLTVIPEILRVSPDLRLIIYGFVLLFMVVVMPKGLAGLLKSAVELKHYKGKPPSQEITATHQSKEDPKDHAPS